MEDTAPRRDWFLVEVVKQALDKVFVTKPEQLARLSSEGPFLELASVACSDCGQHNGRLMKLQEQAAKAIRRESLQHNCGCNAAALKTFLATVKDRLHAKHGLGMIPANA